MNKTIEKSEKIFIGLDIGTESVGYALTNENYQVPQIGGKPLMGVRLFDTAETAENRRMQRAAKVRLQRVKKRIVFLQELLGCEIERVDSLFFIRLKSSSYWQDDKQLKGLDSLNSLFADVMYDDKGFYKQFKTIYHLRAFLMDEENWKKAVPDMRLVYLACHHILKNRGHFLYENDIDDSNNDTFDVLSQGKILFEKLNDYFQRFAEDGKDDDRIFNNVHFNLDNFNEIQSIAKDERIGKKQKNEKLRTEFKIESKGRAEKILSIICASKVKISDIFGEGYQNDEVTHFELEKNWETEEPKYRGALDDGQFELLMILKEIYDWFMLLKLLKGFSSISDAMVSKFDLHKKQLDFLKALLKKYEPKLYCKFFRESNHKDVYDKGKIANYAHYIGSNLVDGKSILSKGGSSSQDIFYEFIKQELYEKGGFNSGKEFSKQVFKNFIKKDENGYFSFEYDGYKLEDMHNDIEERKFLQKLRSGENATIPHQLHKAELKKILTLAEKYELISDEKDTDSFSLKDKIISIISFRVPYFVGRTNPYFKDKEGRHVWIKRSKQYNELPQTVNGKLRPWNFEKAIDLDASGEKFITRMLSKCSRLRFETVMAKNSLVYAKYSVLNELNKLKINDNPISVELKQDIFNELFKVYKKVSTNKLLEYLNTKGIHNAEGEMLTKEDLSGFDIKIGFTTSLSSFIQAKDVFGDEVFTDEFFYKTQEGKMYDEVIKWHAIHTDKKLVENSIKKEYKSLLEQKYGDNAEDIIKKLKAINFSGFGNMSEKFLTTPIQHGNDDNKTVIKFTGLVNPRISVLNILWDTNENLNEIIWNNEYGFKSFIDAENNISESDSVEDFKKRIQESYASPSVKRSVWQAIKVVNELIELIGNRPDKIFIEVTRSGNEQKGDKGRTKSRRQKIEEIYKEAKKLAKEIKDEGLLDKLGNVDDAKLRSERIFLYFMQGGKCAYSGESINFDDVLGGKSSSYDIDHIIPQALIKDDSFNNLVLAKRNLNGEKGKNYPLNKTPAIAQKLPNLKVLWKKWLDSGMITQAKYERLSRTAELSDKELEGFIARQLVFTGQATTVVAELLKDKYETEHGKQVVFYSKAENVSAFRHKFDILKCREINDYHHAHDAYLNIVVGNVWHTRFNSHFYKTKYQDEKQKRFNANKLFEYDVENVWEKPQFETEERFKKDGTPYQKQTQKIIERTGTLAVVDKVFKYNFLPVSKKLKSKGKDGSLYDATVYGVNTHQKDVKKGKKLLSGDGSDDNSALISLKGKQHILSDTSKYGGFKSAKTAYFIIYKYTNAKEERITYFDQLPQKDKKAWEGKTPEQKIDDIVERIKLKEKSELDKQVQKQEDRLEKIRNKIKQSFLDEEKIDEIKKEIEKIKNFDPQVKIIRDKVYLNSLFEIGTMRVRLAGCNITNVTFHNAKQWIIDYEKEKETVEYVRIISEFNERLKKEKKKADEYVKDGKIILSGEAKHLTKTKELTKEKNEKLWDTILSKLRTIYPTSEGKKMEQLKGKNLGLPDVYPKLKENIEKFLSLEITTQIEVLTGLIQGMGCNAKAFDLSSLGLGNSVGAIQPLRKISKDIPLTLISQSVTGLKEKRIIIKKAGE
ncbi:MAG: type II CRISPR RNA-guided endonuclease Cas9 [Firmicutes bacterium]|nr:type II CRISPR RNA-guided endonuclease Cas9 [Bacillota bacterium]